MIKLKNRDSNNEVEYYIQNIFPLDNFSAFAVKVDGITYKTSEHAFQTLKFINTAPEIALLIQESFSPYLAREIAAKYKSQRREDWSEVKYAIMKRILKAKTEQNHQVMQSLLGTSSHNIIEDCGEDNDKDWGCGIDGTGENNLGKIWMSIRDELIHKKNQII